MAIRQREVIDGAHIPWCSCRNARRAESLPQNEIPEGEDVVDDKTGSAGDIDGSDVPNATGGGNNISTSFCGTSHADSAR